MSPFTLGILDTISAIVLHGPFGVGLRISTLLKPNDENEARQEIEEAVAALTKAEALTASLRTHLEEQKIELQGTLAEYQRYQALAQTEREKAKAVIEEVKKVTGWGERLIGLGLNILVSAVFFSLGIIVAAVTGV